MATMMDVQLEIARTESFLNVFARLSGSDTLGLGTVYKNSELSLEKNHQIMAIAAPGKGFPRFWLLVRASTDGFYERVSPHRLSTNLHSIQWVNEGTVRRKLNRDEALKMLLPRCRTEYIKLR